MLSKITVRTIRLAFLFSFFLCSIVVGIGGVSQQSHAKTSSAKLSETFIDGAFIELVQIGPSLGQFDFDLLTGPPGPFAAAVDALIGAATNDAQADALLIRLAELLASAVRQRIVGP